MNSQKKVVMALSGGLDSGTMLGYLINLGYEVECLNFSYGSKHNGFEMYAAKKLANHYNIKVTTIELNNIFVHFKSDLLLSGGEIPEGHYNDENMTKTVVPGRNSIFATILMGYAESIKAGKIALGVHRGDHNIYPDCRQEYIKVLDSLVYLASDKKIEVITPFIDMDKIEVCKIGNTLSVPFELTRTCYKNQVLSCGKCGSCNERLEAFKMNNLEDPIQYENDNSLTIEKENSDILSKEEVECLLNKEPELKEKEYDTVPKADKIIQVKIPNNIFESIKKFENVVNKVTEYTKQTIKGRE